MKYRVDIELTGYMTVEVEAESKDEAEDKAISLFVDKHFKDPIEHLQSKSTCASVLTED